MKMQEDYTNYSEEELKALINELTPKIRRKAVLSGILGIIGTVCGIIALIWFKFLPSLGFAALGFIAITAASVLVTTANRKRREIKYAISDNIVRSVITDRFDIILYSPGGYLRKGLIRAGDLIHGWNRISGSDLIKGSYRGVRFAFSDVYLEYEKSNNRNRKKRTVIFKGQWLILELLKTISCNVQLRERSDTSSEKSDIETENIEFNRRFQIIAPNKLNAFYVLTPQFIEQILNARNRANSRTFISFDGNKMHVALHNGRDLFELCDKKNPFAVSNMATLRMQMRWDVNYIANVIDEFLKNECLFGEVKYAP
jgi:hypothetical protein